MKINFFTIIYITSFSVFSQPTVTDVSGNIYKTVKIGNQIWMAENLRTEKFRNGDPIEQITSNRYWQQISVRIRINESYCASEIYKFDMTGSKAAYEFMIK
jgi:uncharacterized protein (TIGR02145 family)